MKRPKRQTVVDGKNRRDFIKKTILVPVAMATGGSTLISNLYGQGAGTKVSIVTDTSDSVLQQPPVRWALQQLQGALKARDISYQSHERLEEAPSGNEVILLARAGSAPGRQVAETARISIPDVPESLGLLRGTAKGRAVLLVSGSDARGLTYGLLEVADRLTHSSTALAALRSVESLSEKPANPIRSVTRYFESDVEDKSWFYDKSFWQSYLSMLMAQRFNRFSLAFGLGYNRPRNVHDTYLYFAYPFLFAVPGYRVRVRELADEERDRNLAMVRWIGEQVTARGLDFQLGLWTHAYQWIDSPKANYTIEGLTPENHAGYCRDALHQLLETCPTIKGITLRGHSESGIPEGSYDFWQELFKGTAKAGRRVEIDIHAKGIEHKLIDMALATGNPVNLSPKYWAEHMGLPYHQASIRDLERNPPGGSQARIEQERRFTRYGYGDYLREDRKYGVLYRIWPGTQRTLLWGDPAMAAGYGRYAHFCGSSGVEISDPLSFKGRMGSGLPGDRNAYADTSLRPSADWEKHAYTYRLWGRLLYNPEAAPDSWRRFLTSEFRPAAKQCEAALGHASRILPLVTTAHHPSASNNTYWPEIYTNMPIVNAERRHPYGDTPSPKRFGTVSSLDPALFSTIEEFVDEIVKGHRGGRNSPLDVARWLETNAEAAENHLAKAQSALAASKNPSFKRLTIDVSVQSGLGHFFAQKLRAGVAYTLYERTQDRAVLEKALKHYRAARDSWKKIATQTKGVYLEDISYGPTPHLRGHWADRLPAIEQDLADMESKWKEPGEAESGSGDGELPVNLNLEKLLAASPTLRPRCEHLPPASFQRGRPITIEMAVEASYDVTQVRLHYRHVNQAETYRVEEMSSKGNRYDKAITGKDTDSSYPLMYFFELHSPNGEAWLYPGFRPDLMNQPYFVVRQV